MKKIYECTLPFPVSENNAYRVTYNKKKKFHMKSKTKELLSWLDGAPLLMLPDGGCIDYPVYIWYLIYMPDYRLRDVGNFVKSCQDYLVKQCIIEDDNWKIVQGAPPILMGVDKKNPRVEVVITLPEHAEKFMSTLNIRGIVKQK